MRKSVLILLLFFFGVFGLSNLNRFPDGGSVLAETFGFSEPEQIRESRLHEVVGKALEGTKGDYAVAIKNLSTGEDYYQNEEKIYKSASLYKLWVMATVFDEIEKGELKEDEVLSRSIPYLNQKFGIDPAYAELNSGGITASVSQALNQMITISHNYAALLLSEKIGLSGVERYLVDEGFTNSKVGTDGDLPETNAKEMALFLEKLYKNELASIESTNKMLNLMKKQQLNGKLPKYLPEGTQIAHKTGELDYFSHDAGIVYTPKGDYVIVVLSESESPQGANERIAEVSRAVYEYFMME